MRAEIAGYPGYVITADGTVLSCKTNCGFRPDYRPLRPSRDAKGYLGLTLCAADGTRRKARVHRLVAEAFIHNPAGLPCVRHLDGSKANNSADNLAWGTYQDNENDKHAHGTYWLRRNGKLSEADRSDAFRLKAEGWSQEQLAARFDVSRATITRLLNGSTWSGI